MRRARQVAVRKLLWAVCHVAKKNKEKPKKRGQNCMRNLWKKMQRIIVCTLMFAMMVTLGVSAAESTASADDGYFTKTYGSGNDQKVVRFTKATIKDGTTCNLHIYKYRYSAVDSGIDGTALPDATIPDGATLMQNVSFKYYKVADLVTEPANGDEEAKGSVSLQYKWCSDVIAAKIKKELGLPAQNTYTSDQLNKSLLDADKTNVETAFRDVASIATGADGHAWAKDIPMGLYLVVEYSPTDTVAVKAAPFFVSLPMTNVRALTLDSEADESPAGSLWQYDVYTYPKNVEAVPDIEKNIVNDKTNREEKYSTASVGDTVEFVIRASIPDNIDTMSAFTVVDTMSAGLTFAGAENIKIEGVTLTEGTTPTFDLDEANGVLTWKFIEREIVKDEDNYDKVKITKHCLKGQGGKELVIRYKAILNDDCVVGSTGNPNGVKLQYNHNNRLDKLEEDTDLPHEPLSRVYTFGIEVTKVDDHSNGLDGVEFELYDQDQNKIKLKQLSANTAVNAGLSEATNQYCIDSESGAEGVPIVTDKNGKAYIWGLEPGVYYLKETKTKDERYTLLKELIKVTITEDPNLEALTPDETKQGGIYAGETGTYLTSASGTYYKLVAGEYKAIDLSKELSNYNFGTHKIYTKNADGSYEEVKNLLYAKVRAEADDEEGFSSNGTNIALTVINNQKFNAPQSGGMGTWMFTLCGAVIIVAASGLILIRRKRSMAR